MACCIDVTERVKEAADYGVDLRADPRLQIMENGRKLYVYDLNRESIIDGILSDLREGRKSNT